MGQLVYIVLVFGICLLPLVGMSVARTDETTEKTEMASWPKLTVEGRWNTDYLEQMGEYFEDHFAFRQELITANSLLRAKVLRSSGTEKVVTGQEGWLYYKASVDDYLGRNVMTDRGAYNAAHNLALMQQYVEARGGKFLFTIAPNKMSLYPQALPYYYQKVSDENNQEKLVDQMAKERVNYVDLYGLFRQQDEVLYLKRDSHWNNKGAVLAYNTLMDAARKSHETYEDVPCEVRQDWVGDLDTMLYPLAEEPEENIYYDKEPEYSYLNDAKSVEDDWIVTGNPDQTGRLLMYRDSFGNTLLPLFSNEFEQGFYSKLYPYPVMANVEQYQPHLVLVERVERHLSMLAQQPPIMEGPKVEISGTVESLNTDTDTFVRSTENYVEIYGKLDERYVTEQTRIYVKVQGEGEDPVVYEAFPITAVMSGEKTDYGYRLYIRRDSLPARAKAEILIQNEDQFFSVANTERLENKLGGY